MADSLKSRHVIVIPASLPSGTWAVSVQSSLPAYETSENEIHDPHTGVLYRILPKRPMALPVEGPLTF